MLSGGDGRHAGRGVEIYDATENFWILGAPMLEPRSRHSLIALEDGRILAFGGKLMDGGVQKTSELYAPEDNVWEPAGGLPASHGDGRAVLLANGKVLVAGGLASDASRNTSIFDPLRKRWDSGRSMQDARTDFALIPLKDGSVFASGGASVNRTLLKSAEVYDPVRDNWRSVAPMLSARKSHCLFQLNNGLILAAGGETLSGALADAEVYDPAKNAWTVAPPLKYARADAECGYSRGSPVMFGGRDGDGSLNTVEAYDARKGWKRMAPLNRPRVFMTATPLRDGRFLIAGGRHRETLLATVEFWSPDVRAPLEEESDVAESLQPLPPRRLRESRPKDYALVIGIDSYKSLPNAAFAGNDARSVYTAMQELGIPAENIALLNNERATLSAVTKYIEEWLPRHAVPESRVYVYFSGHGAPELDSGSPFLLPWDADATFVKSTGYSLSKLYAVLDKNPAREIIVALDSCFSGTGARSIIAPGIRPIVAVKMPAISRGRLTIMTAAEKDEAAGTSTEVEHGIFTLQLLNGLSGAADADSDKHLTVAELHAFARKNVILSARAQDREQTPTLSTPTPDLRLY